MRETSLFMPFTDKYVNFEALAQSETEHVDYRVHVRYGHTGVALLAPHGGRIERGTTQIAKAIAGDDHAYYCFEGIKPGIKANRDLHLTSNHFDEPRALKMVEKADHVVTIHGAAGSEVAIYTGGLDLELRRQLFYSLTAAGFTIRDDPSPTRQGRGLTNICNRGASGRGLQLELTFGLRKLMFSQPDQSGVKRPTALFHRLVNASRNGIARVIY